MREMTAAALAILERRTTLIAVPMLYIEARRRRDDGTLGAIEGVGLWRGEVDEDIIVRDLFTGHDVRRAFFASGLLDITGVQFEAGLSVRPLRVRLSSISEPVLAAVAQYDARGARVQAWRRYYDPDTLRPVAGKPVRLFKGFANHAPSERPAPGGEAALELEVVTTARTLTEASGLKKSDAAQQRRDGDRIARYKGTVSTWSIPWGVKDEKEKGGGKGGGDDRNSGPGYDDGGH